MKPAIAAGRGFPCSKSSSPAGNIFAWNAQKRSLPRPQALTLLPRIQHPIKAATGKYPYLQRLRPFCWRKIREAVALFCVFGRSRREKDFLLCTFRPRKRWGKLPGEGVAYEILLGAVKSERARCVAAPLSTQTEGHPGDGGRSLRRFTKDTFPILLLQQGRQIGVPICDERTRRADRGFPG